MLEIPESTTIAGQMNEMVKGLKIKEVETEHTKHSFAWYHGNPSAYAEKMQGSGTVYYCPVCQEWEGI